MVIAVAVQECPRVDQTGFSLSRYFNQCAADTSEVELKFIAARNDPELFQRMVSYFEERGWLRYINDDKQLLTRQLDTPERDFRKHGDSTVRVRARCKDADLGLTDNADICIKSGKTEDASGAIRRTEYQARIAHFENPDFSTLRDRYDPADHPELHGLLDKVDPLKLREYFRIDSLHRRCVIELPEDQTRLEGKRFVAEIVLDDCVFLASDENGALLPIHRDQEVESELLSKPDDYDTHPLAPDTHSSELTEDEANRAMHVLKHHIMAAATDTLVPNSVSKAERGMKALEGDNDSLSQGFPALQGRKVAYYSLT